MIKIWNKLRSIHQQVMGLNQRNLELIYPNNPKRNYKYADDKYLAKEILEQNGIACPKTYACISSVAEIEETWNVVSQWNELVIKPAKGAGGKGIMILKRQQGLWYKGGQVIAENHIFTHIANIIFGIFSFGDDDVALIESYVRPHPCFKEIYSDGVPDIRVIVLDQEPIMAMLRMPTNQSGGKANLHQGGLGIGVNMVNGKLKEAYDGKNFMKTHPDSGNKIEGVVLPYWLDILTLSIETARHFPLNFIGVDLVIDEHLGPMVMEVNVRPGLGIQLANKQGLKSVIKQQQSKT